MSESLFGLVRLWDDELIRLGYYITWHWITISYPLTTIRSLKEVKGALRLGPANHKDQESLCVVKIEGWGRAYLRR